MALFTCICLPNIKLLTSPLCSQTCLPRALFKCTCLSPHATSYFSMCLIAFLYSCLPLHITPYHFMKLLTLAYTCSYIYIPVTKLLEPAYPTMNLLPLKVVVHIFGCLLTSSYNYFFSYDVSYILV